MTTTEPTPIEPRIIQRARQLVALRDGAATPGEAEAATRALAVLFEKHRLTEAVIEQTTETADDPMTTADGYVYARIDGRTSWRIILLSVLASHHGVATYRAKVLDRGRGCGFRYRVALIGRSSDVAIVRYFFGWLVAETVRLAKQHPSVSRPSFCAGFCAGVRAQLASARTEARQNASSTAITIVDRRHGEAEAHALATYHVRGQVTVSASPTDAAAYYSGRADGERVHLGERLAGKAS